jgi:predicted lipid-binding transport protein (Tim44 family)
MSKKKTQKPKSGGGKTPGKGGGKDRQALRGMLIGMGLIALAAGFFMVPIAGKTTFSHLLGALGLDGASAEAVEKNDKNDKAAPAKPKSEGRLLPREVEPETRPKAPASRRAAAPAPVRPAGVKVAQNLGRRAPMEQASAADDAELERLVRQHGER